MLFVIVKNNEVIKYHGRTSRTGAGGGPVRDATLRRSELTSLASAMAATFFLPSLPGLALLFYLNFCEKRKKLPPTSA